MWNVDADPRNADWIKTQGWDLPTDPDKFLASIGGRDRLAHFLTLPAARAMPPSLLTALGLPTDALLALRAQVTKFNPNHDERGRFAEAPGGPKFGDTLDTRTPASVPNTTARDFGHRPGWGADTSRWRSDNARLQELGVIPVRTPPVVPIPVAPGQIPAGIVPEPPPPPPFVPAATLPDTPQVKTMLTADVTNRDYLGGGTNRVYTAKVGGVDVLIKPESGLDSAQNRDNIPQGTDIERELATQYINNQFPGGLVDMPVAVERDVPGLGRSLVEQFRESDEEVGSYENVSDDDELHRVALLDAVVGNLDRHGGNGLLDENGHFIAIDHGLTFPLANDYNNYGNTRATDEADVRDLRGLSKDEYSWLKAFTGAKDSVNAGLTSLGIEPEAQKAMWDRVAWMAVSKKILTSSQLENGLGA